MSSGHPQTPQSPSCIDSVYDHPFKPSTSPRISNNLPTPAHSINGSMSSLNSDMVYESSQTEEGSTKRKREIEDTGDRELKKLHVETSRMSIDDLHLDVGKKYSLCKTPHLPRQPPHADDLFERYGLNDLAKSVARVGPDGESKGVKLRKTYKNHIKEHNVSGAFDSKKREWESPDSLFSMMSTPEDVWSSEHSRGKEIGNDLPPNIDAMLSKAFSMSRGPIDKSRWDSAVLGELAAPAPSVESSKGAQIGSRTVPPQGGTLARTKADLSRPKRTTNKRSYQDSSYEGYNDTFPDDGYSTGDGDDRGRKNPKKAKVGTPIYGKLPAKPPGKSPR